MTAPQLFHVIAGERQAAGHAMRDFNSGGRGYTSPVYRAMAHAALDEDDRALECLSRAAWEHDYWLLNIAVDPAFDRLRGRAEFSAILRDIGLPDLEPRRQETPRCVS